MQDDPGTGLAHTGIGDEPADPLPPEVIAPLQPESDAAQE
jgi:hypothetical protein